MDEQFSTITYDENWQSVSEPEVPVPTAGEDASDSGELLPQSRPKSAPRHLLLTLQLLCCVLLGVAAFALKGIGGDVYDTVRTWYFSQISDTAIFDGSHSPLPQLGATADEA